jgi:hypothetical protein
VAVGVLAGAVIPHRGAWTGVAGRDKCVPEHVRMRSGDAHPGGLG